MPTKHRHKWKISALCGRTIEFACTCEAKAERKMTDKEWEQYLSDSKTDNLDLFALWHDFLKKVHKKKSHKTKELLLGYDYILAAEAWMDKYPDKGIIDGPGSPKPINFD